MILAGFGVLFLGLAVANVFVFVLGCLLLIVGVWVPAEAFGRGVADLLLGNAAAPEGDDGDGGDS